MLEKIAFKLTFIMERRLEILVGRVGDHWGCGGNSKTGLFLYTSYLQAGSRKCVGIIHTEIPRLSMKYLNADYPFI